MRNYRGILLGLPLLFLMAFAPAAMAQKASHKLLGSSPLKNCESALNCTHKAYPFDVSPSKLASITLEVLKANKHLDSVSPGTVNNHRIEAVFNAWKYKDDVQIAINVHEEGSVLYIRSESREGTYDLGVNKRRVNGIIKGIKERL